MITKDVVNEEHREKCVSRLSVVLHDYPSYPPHDFGRMWGLRRSEIIAPCLPG